MGGLWGGLRLVWCFVLSTLASLLSPCPPRRLRLAKVTGPGRAPSFGDPLTVGAHQELGDKRGHLKGQGQGRAAGFWGAPCSPAWQRQEGLFTLFVNTIFHM